MASTIRLNDTDIEIAKRAAQINNRSTAGQIAHWMTIGRIIEQSPSYDHDRVESALKAELDYDDLSADEQDVVLEQFHNSMRSLSETDEAAFLAEIEAVETPTSLGVFGIKVMDDFAEALRDKFNHDEISEMSWIKDIKGLGFINRQGERGFTLLMLAVLCDRLTAAEKLIASGADIFISDESGNTPVHVAARMDNYKILAALLKGQNQESFDVINENTLINPLMEAVIAGKDPSVHLLANPVSASHQDRAGNTALHFAVGPERVELAVQLLKAGANPFTANNNHISFADLLRSENIETMTTPYKLAQRKLRAAIREWKTNGLQDESKPSEQYTQSAG